MMNSARVVSALVALLSAAAFGQTEPDKGAKTVQITGRVVDASSLPLPRATVTLTALESKTHPSTIFADEKGTFIFPSMSSQTYELRFEKGGFKTRTIRLEQATAADDILNVGAVVMEIGDVTEGRMLVADGKGIRPTRTTLCDLVTAPERFNGQIVSLNSRILIAFEDFELSARSCQGKKIDSVWLEYGRGPKRQPTTWCCGDIVPRDPL